MTITCVTALGYLVQKNFIEKNLIFPRCNFFVSPKLISWRFQHKRNPDLSDHKLILKYFSNSFSIKDVPAVSVVLQDKAWFSFLICKYGHFYNLYD